MANPAPTINQINAFNATQGTTIDFNIIGGTELVRSNRIYIYDLSDNSLICTHLYVSTESIHELPPNTDGSIVYESGKSSADFVNGAQYYAQIQTFTDIAGTEGGSGLSVSKLFWCLVDPSLTIATIPSSISTTSYNVSATYDANTSVVSNIIQQYQFSLYSATGSLLQSSGVVVGNGEQQGTSTAYDISYNFSGLSVGSSYYVVVDITTTQGMSISAQSSTFTVSIDTPTLGEATVVNNACDGYISVTSNLSSEHSHSYSVDASEVMSFTTDSPNDVTKLQVNFNPIQEGTPWMASTYDTDPYTFRAIPNVNHSINSEFDTLVGGTVNWNQLVQNGNFADTSGWSGAGYGTVTASNNIGTITLSDAGTSGRIERSISLVNGHKVFCIANIKPSFSTNLYITFAGTGAGAYVARMQGATANAWNTVYGIKEITNNDLTSGVVRYYFGGVAGSIGATVQFKDITIVDLTAFFGNSAIADYIYSLETATAGAGIAWLRKYFPKLFVYTPYNTGTLESVKPTAHVTRGVNQFDKSTATAGKRLGSFGQSIVDRATGSISDYIKVLPNTVYYAKDVSGSGQGNTIVFYDGNKQLLGYVDVGVSTKESGTFTTLANCMYIRFQYETVNENTVCINISNPSLNGQYFPYESNTYPISELELRGVSTLVDGELRFDGDTRKANGQVSRKYYALDLGSINWGNPTSNGEFRGYKKTSDPTPVSVGVNEVSKSICSKYVLRTAAQTYSGTYDKSISVLTSYFSINDSSYSTGADLKAALSGVYLYYPVDTPTIETAEPFTSPQTIYSGGTEEYITTGLVPVGHQSRYADIYPINGTSDVSVDIVGANQWDEEAEKGGYSSLTGVKETGTSKIRNANKIRCLPNTTYYIACSGTYTGWVALYFYDADENFISSNAINHINNPFTTPSDAYYMCFNTSDNYGATYNHDISINYPSTNTSYHAYNGQTITQQFDGSYVTYTPTTTNDDPYLFKKTGDVRGDRESFELVGGTVVWNQLAPIASTATKEVEGVTITNNQDGSFTLNGTCTATTDTYLGVSSHFAVVPNHVYLIPWGDESSQILWNGYSNKQIHKNTWSLTAMGFYIHLVNGHKYTNKKVYLIATDLTEFFGSSEIAEYVQSLEQTTNGVGIAWLQKYFPNLFAYLPRNTGTLESVKPTAHVTTGVNQWDEEWELGQFNNSTGEPYSANDCIRTKNYISATPNTEYYTTYGEGKMQVFFYKSDGTFISTSWVALHTFTTPNECYKMKFRNASAYGTTYHNDICINLSNSDINGKYYPYESHTYPISELELRGMPILVDGELRFDGDTRKASGSVTRKYGIVDLGGLDWTFGTWFQASNAIPDAKATALSGNNVVVPINAEITTFANSTSTTVLRMGISAAGSIRVSAAPPYNTMTAAQFKTAMNNVYMVYEKTTPTIETADAYEVPQIVNPLGTEEFVDTRSTPIPVGNNTQYFKREVFGGYIDLVSGVLTMDKKMANLGDLAWTYHTDAERNGFYANIADKQHDVAEPNMLCSVYPTYTVNGISIVILSSMPDKSITGFNNASSTNSWVYVKDSAYTDADTFKSAMNGVQLSYPLATPLTYQLTPHQLQTLTGQNNLRHDTNGEMTIMYQLPITNLLVKRQDVDDVSGNWLTLYSQSVEQASDMDFTFIDFLNQYGKTYKYALVPLLTQQQSGVEVEVEGGYTVSDAVQSIFDGVYIGDSTGIQRLKAGVAYNNLNTNQQVGVIPTLGNKYPVIVSNGNIQYDTGSVSGLIVPDDFYSDGNLSRLDMSNKREVISSFITNKKPKVLKDWNGNIWLVVFTDNVDVSFDNNYGMGVATFTSGWTEVGDPTNQEDLQRTGLINVGGD